VAVDAYELVNTSLDDLMAAAAHKRNALFGPVISYSPKVFIPLTMLCRDRCGYCTFAKAPAHLDAAYLELDQVLAIARKGQERGCTEALFTLGERPELRYEQAADWLSGRGYDSTVSYLAAAMALVRDETGLLPHANAGALDREELSQLRGASASQGMMLESLRSDLEAHRLAPDKTPERRLATLEYAGELKIPFTTGLLIGIGENRQDRLEALVAIAESHQRYGHVQEVIIQNFLPKPGTAMAKLDPAPLDEFLWSIAAARMVLPDDIHLQAPPNLIDDVSMLIDAGIDDLGGISPVTLDHVNPERAWPEITRLSETLSSLNKTLLPRLTIYPSFANQPDVWIDEANRSSVLALQDAEGFGRGDAWVSGGEAPPPQLLALTHGPIRDEIAGILADVVDGARLDEDQMVALFSARGREVAAVAEVADQLRRDIAGDEVTFVRNRNINYTNVCTFKCRFCAFSKGPLSLNLRGDPYLLDLSEITRRVSEAEELGCTEVCMVGGIHPSFDGDYYLDVIEAARKGSASMHIHALTALEVHEGAKRSGVDLEEYLIALKERGLKTLPGTAAEILDDDVRAVLCPDKVNTREWLEVHEVAHSVGLKSNVTIMFGSVEKPHSWAKHISVTRELGERTGGFTEFVPLPFVHMATPIFLRGRSRKGPTFRETLLMHAVGRLAYGTAIPSVQASWVKIGQLGARQLLQAGVNDLGGTLMDENISRAAGASHGQAMDEESLQDIVAPLGRPLVQRTTLYGRVCPNPSPVASSS
jgi:FO synthase